MPELPEVETIARQLAPVLKGATVESVLVARRDVIHGTRRSLGRALPGRRIESVTRRAKRLVIALKPESTLTFHLGMSGRLTLEPPDARRAPHTHLRIRFTGVAQELRFCDPRRFGGVWFDTADERPPSRGRRLGPVGLEPLEATAHQFRRLLDRNRQIKALLLDQTVIAGLGNIYCDESLHRAGLHPCALATAIDQTAALRLLQSIKTVLRSAIRHNGSTLMDYRTAEGAPGSFQRRHRVYQRDGMPCRTCQTPIVRSIVAGRSTFHCPNCQPVNGRLPMPRALSLPTAEPALG